MSLTMAKLCPDLGPLSSDLEAMRLTLMSGLLETVQENSKRSKAGLRFFEVGRRYLPAAETGSLPDERRSVGIALCGPAEISWVPELAGTRIHTTLN